MSKNGNALRLAIYLIVAVAWSLLLILVGTKFQPYQAGLREVLANVVPHQSNTYSNSSHKPKEPSSERLPATRSSRQLNESISVDRPPVSVKKASVSKPKVFDKNFVATSESTVNSVHGKPLSTEVIETPATPPKPSLPPLKRGVVLTSQCSGSSWLTSTLSSVPGVHWADEPLMDYSLNTTKWSNVGWKEYRRDLESSFPVTEETRGENITWTGFKLMYNQIPQHLFGQVAAWLNQNHIFVIHLRRRCAALQFASQIEKRQRLRKVQSAHIKLDVNHFTNKSAMDALGPVEKINIEQPQFQRAIRMLEENQEGFSRFLRVNCVYAPVFEISYEDLDGPHKLKWFNALLEFLGLRGRLSSARGSDLVKTGSRLCESRLEGLGGEEYTSLSLHASRYECMRLRAHADWNITQPSEFVKSQTFPPNLGQCRWSPSCLQDKYLAQYPPELISLTETHPNETSMISNGAYSTTDNDEMLIHDVDPDSTTNQPIGMMPNKRGIILTSQSSGSSWLIAALNSIPGVIWTHEPLVSYSLDSNKWNTVSWEDYRKDLEHGFSGPALKPGETVTWTGYRISYDQIPERFYLEFARWLNENHIYVIHLHRRCAAMQLASQIEAAQRAALNGTTSAVRKLTLQDPQWRVAVGVLEVNRQRISRYLRVNLVMAPVFEVTREDLAGPHKLKWFNAVLGYLGLIGRLSMPSGSNVVEKVGATLCEGKIDDLGGNEYKSLSNLESRVECARLHVQNDWKVRPPEYVKELTFPPRDGQCRLAPDCWQKKYMRQYMPHNPKLTPNEKLAKAKANGTAKQTKGQTIMKAKTSIKKVLPVKIKPTRKPTSKMSIKVFANFKRKE
jgi:hypothetical protein